MDWITIKPIVEHFWAAGMISVIIGFAGYWERVLPQEKDLTTKVQWLLNVSFTRRCCSLRQLMNAVTARTDLFTGVGSENEPYAVHLRSDDHYCSQGRMVRATEDRLNTVRAICTGSLYVAGAILLFGLLLSHLKYVKTVAFASFMILLLIQAAALLLGRKAVTAPPLVLVAVS